MCDGSCVYMDQDGPSSYICECSCHRAAREAARLPHALARVRQVLIEERLDRTYEVVPKASETITDLFGADVMVEKVDGFYWCPDCPTYGTPFALRFAHHRRTVHASASGRTEGE